ncbi:hypothetical protein F4802DRAFT_612656 [Xylaria palmicola]|nr:hypothetical protein F4802DRAFT_612656 [Xylaria palmicola]
MTTMDPSVDPNDPGRGPWIIAVTWIFTGIAILAVAGQFYVRKKSKVPLGWADWLLLASVIVRVAHQIQVSISLKYGLGKHDVSLTPYQLVMINKSNWSSIPTNTFVSTVPRIAITILLIRLFGVHIWLKWFLICLITLQVLLGIGFIAITYAMITPVEALWNIFITDAKRWDPNVWVYYTYLLQSVYTFADLAYVLCPILIVWRLNMNLRRRIGLIILFLGGVLTTTLSILKAVWVSATAKSTENTPDVQYDASLQVLFGLLEQTFVIIIACVPALRNVSIIGNLFSEMGNSLLTLIWRTTQTKSRVGASNGQSASSSGYVDLELSTHKLGAPPRTTYIPNTSVTKGASHECLTDNDTQVRRVDEFAVSYD